MRGSAQAAQRRGTVVGQREWSAPLYPHSIRQSLAVGALMVRMAQINLIGFPWPNHTTRAAHHVEPSLANLKTCQVAPTSHWKQTQLAAVSLYTTGQRAGSGSGPAPGPAPVLRHLAGIGCDALSRPPSSKLQCHHTLSFDINAAESRHSS